MQPSDNYMTDYAVETTELFSAQNDVGTMHLAFIDDYNVYYLTYRRICIHAELSTMMNRDVDPGHACRCRDINPSVCC